MVLIGALGIGGTNLHSAVMTDTGEFHTSMRTQPTDQRGLTSQVIDAVDELCATADGELAAVSISCKGLVDRERGVIAGMNTPDGDMLEDIDVRSPITETFELPCYLENDCSGAALAEYEFGAGTDYDSLAHVTIGTGIGGGVVDHGHLVRGDRNQAAEIGSITVGPPDGLEQFGIPGAWEAYCSGPGIAQYVAAQLREESRATVLQNLDPVTPESVFAAAEHGDAVAAEYLETIAAYNAQGCAILIKLFDPGVITLGGGVVLNNFEWFVDGIGTYLEQYLFDRPPAFVRTALGEQIGMYAAVAGYRYLSEHEPVAPTIRA